MPVKKLRDLTGLWLATPFVMSLVPTIRALLKSRGETLLALLALAAGIGLSTTLFSLVKSIAWSEPPVPESERLLRVDMPPAEASLLVGHLTKTAQVAGVAVTGKNCEVAGVPRRLQVAYVSPNFFDVLRVQPVLGSPLRDGESALLAVISHSLWETGYRADPQAVGSKLKIQGQDATIIGVMAPEFGFPRAEHVWVAWHHSPENPVAVQGRGSDAFVLGRLAKNASVAEARAEVNVVARRQRELRPGEPLASVAVRSYAESNVKAGLPVLLSALLLCCFFVLLIACANVANLSLARAARRMTELAVRASLGATRGQLVAVLLQESFLLAVGGAAFGILLASVALDTLRSAIAQESLLTGGGPAWMRFEIDGTALAFVGLLTIISALAAGLAPALRASRSDVEPLLRSGARSVTLPVGRFSRVLIHVQLAGSVLLLVGAGLMSTLTANTAKDLRFDPKKVLSARVSLDAQEYSDANSRRRFFEALEKELTRTPGLEAAGVLSAEHIERGWSSGVEVDGRATSRNLDRVSSNWQAVSSGYFEVFGSSLQSGRLFGGQDAEASQKVAIVNRSFASRHWPDAEPTGKRFRLTSGPLSGQWLSVIGVVQDVGSLRAGHQERTPWFYVPVAQMDLESLSIVARSRTDAVDALPLARNALRTVAPTQPLYQVHTAEEVMELESIGIKIPAMLFAACGVSALFLAAVGAYGVLSLAAKQRTREIGIRLALGADFRTIMKAMLLDGSRQVGGGITIGLLLALVLNRVLASLFGSFPGELQIYLGVAVIMAAVGFFAVAIPARTAASLHPLEALRED